MSSGLDWTTALKAEILAILLQQNGPLATQVENINIISDSMSALGKIKAQTSIVLVDAIQAIQRLQATIQVHLGLTKGHQCTTGN